MWNVFNLKYIKTEPASVVVLNYGFFFLTVDGTVIVHVDLRIGNLFKARGEYKWIQYNSFANVIIFLRETIAEEKI